MKATRATHFGLFLLSASVLALEIALTRIFSLMLWSHYTFLVISTAILGFGAAGALLAVRKWEPDAEESQRFLARNCQLFAISIVAMLMLVTRLHVDPDALFLETGASLRFFAMYALTAVPFFFAGRAICHLLSACSKQINTIYFADLLGAGVGALSVTVLLNTIGAPGTIAVSCGCGVASALLFAGVRSLKGVTGLAAILVTIAAAFQPWEVPLAASKPLAGSEDRIVETRWSLHGRIDVLEPETMPLSFGSGVHVSHYHRPVEYSTFFMDGGNPSRLIKYDQDRWFFPYLGTAGPYELGIEHPRVAIIGSGGGVDTMMALEFGAADVTALEINPVTVDMVTGTFGDYIGNIFDRPNVHLIAAEGRHFFSLTDQEFDIIRLTGVDTQAAAAAGANAFDHAYVYSVEAIQDFWHHLSEDGVLAINRPNGWQVQRLTNVFLAAIDELGLDDGPAHLLVMSNGRWTDVLLRRRPYTRAEVDGFRGWAARVGHSVLYDPFHESEHVIAQLIRGGPETRAEIIAAQPRNIRPVTDDSPFLLEAFTLESVLASLARGELGEMRASGYPQLLLTLLQAILLSSLFILLPLKLGKGIDKVPGRWWVMTYFALLGMGFILAELVYIQKYMILLGGPAYAMSITLFSILVFSGLGAFAARWIRIRSARALTGTFVLLLAVLGAHAVFLEWGMSHLLGFGFGARVLFSILSLAPVSFTLGLPFPTGIRVLAETTPGLIPWAWASNACLTVIGSVLCVILSVYVGFSAVLVLAGGCYVLAAFCLTRMAGSRPGASV